MNTIIRNVDILDGSGTPAVRGDIGVEGDRIVEIGDLGNAEAACVIDGAGLVAAPGFIDIHSHSDCTLPIDGRAESKIRQGVTTEVVGMCGFGPAPISPESRERLKVSNPDMPYEWLSFGEFLEFLRQHGTSVNVLPFVGHGQIRELGMGLDDRPPTADELATMKRLLTQAMDEGAWGMSTGLIYAPGIYANTDELVELSRVCAERGGLYFSHLRSEDELLLEAVAEAIEIGERAGLPVQIAHFKAAGKKNWDLLGQALELIDAARARGLDISADRYPYLASQTGISPYLPSWMHDGGEEKLVERLKQSDIRQRIVDGFHAASFPWDTMVIARAKTHEEWEGLSVAEIAAQSGADPAETAIDILIGTDAQVSAMKFSMCEDNMRTVLSHPAVMIGSDGSARMPTGPLGKGKSHPRSYGTFVRVLGKCVREDKIFSLPEAVHKMTGMSASRLGLSDRGLLKKGLKADIVLFNPDTVSDTATYKDPYQFPTGVEYVIVNGEIVINPDGHTGALAGRVLDRAS